MGLDHDILDVNSEETTQKTARAVIEYLLEHPDIPKHSLGPIKGRIGKKFGYVNVIKDSMIIAHAKPEEKEVIGRILRRRVTRTISGVTIVAVMTKPYECPGKCIYCPGPDSQPGEKVAQSYTGREPAAMRSAMYKYDPYEQTLHRLEDQAAIGHEIDKIELIVMGGTFLYTPIEYQISFMHGCFDAIINFGLPEYNNHRRTEDMNEAKKMLETSEIRLIGVTFETRPDYCTEQYVDQMLEYGATRVEIGVQTTRDDVLKYVSRGNTVQDAKDSIRIAKDAGLKVNAHMMPNLPLSDPASDIEVFRELFNDPEFRPDMLKIYPTLVVEGTKLFGLYQKGEYVPYSQDEIVKVIAQVKSELPPYVRIQRVQRDIPANLIIDGVKHSNLRQLVQEELKKQGISCRCIRCREEGFYSHQKGALESKQGYEQAELLVLEYEASQGTEFFISIENMSVNVLYAFLRLRIPSKHAHRSEISVGNSAIVREIRVVGELVPHGTEPSIFQIQHRGLGKSLMAKAEEIATQQNCEKILVIAGIGARPYFYKLGYAPDGPYVSKKIKKAVN